MSMPYNFRDLKSLTHEGTNEWRIKIVTFENLKQISFFYKKKKIINELRENLIPKVSICGSKARFGACSLYLTVNKGEGQYKSLTLFAVSNREQKKVVPYIL